MFKKLLILVVSCAGLVCLGVGLKLGWSRLTKPVQKVRITVFIHGTIGGALNIFNTQQYASEKFNNASATARAVKKIRSVELLNYDQIFGALGLHEFNAAETPVWYAARHVIPAYEDVAQCVGRSSDVTKDLIFGWTGFLHHGARKEAGYELYTALCDYRDRMRAKYGVDPDITVIGHSHGGNVGLWLAQAEKEGKRGLQVDSLIMLGSPMQKEMACCIESPLFRTIVLCHSDGDAIQRIDYISNKERKSHQRMSDVADIKAFIQQNPALRRHDVACMINNSARHITHINMWLVGRSTPVLKAFDVVPLVVYLPALMNCLDQHPHESSVEWYMQDSGESCVVSLHPKNLLCQTCKDSACIDGTALHGTVSGWDTMMKSQWQLPDDKSRHVLFNKKNVRALKNLVCALF